MYVCMHACMHVCKTSSARLERALVSLVRSVADRVFARPLDYLERDC